MAGPGVYRKRREKREREKLAEKLADMPWEKDPYTGRVTGWLPGETGDVPPRSPADVERWLRSAGRTNPAAARPGAEEPPEVPSGPGLRDPGGYKKWRESLNLWPAPPSDKYVRWGKEGSRRKYQNWKDWYAPGGEVEDQPHLGVINALLPYMAAEDVDALSRQLYIAGGGRKGPFKHYLGQKREQVFGGKNLQPRKDWKNWARWFESQGMVPEGAEQWWKERPMEGRVRDWEEWWKKRPNKDLAGPALGVPKVTPAQRSPRTAPSMGVPQWQTTGRGIMPGMPGPGTARGTPFDAGLSKAGFSGSQPPGMGWTKPGKRSGQFAPPEGEGKWPEAPPPPVRPGTHRQTMNTIGTILRGIEDPIAKAWAKAVFSVYRGMTPARGVRGSEQEQLFAARLDELFANVPEEAQSYAAALQRLVAPTVPRPEYEFYQLPSAQRTAPTNWAARGLTSNPLWL